MSNSNKRLKLSLKRRVPSDEGSKGEPEAVTPLPATTSGSVDSISSSPSYCGLVNIGNTCYVNAVVQALRFCPRLIDVLPDSLLQSNSKNKDFLVCKALAELFSLMRSSETSKDRVIPINPKLLVQTIQSTYVLFEQNCQHDTHEFLQSMLTTLVHTTQTTPTDNPQLITNFFKQCIPKKNKSQMSEIFKGTLLFETKCLNCEETSTKTEDFLNLTVPVLSTGMRRCGSVSLYCAIDKATSLNGLVADNKYWCDTCQHLTEGRRNALIVQLPTVVTIHINRFTTTLNLSTVQIHKTSGNIAIPTMIRFKQWTTTGCSDRNTVYKLFAIILHTGSSCRSGHYTTIVDVSDGAKSGDNWRWVWFDDDNVSTVSHDYVTGELLSPLSTTDCTPYILFYKII